MREILFRAKRLDNGEWVEGYHLETYGQHYIIPCGTAFAMVTMFGADTLKQVDPETVGQYTEYTDKNGARIFDGDICTVTAWRHGSGQNWYSDKNKNHGNEDTVRIAVAYNDHRNGWMFRYLPETWEQVKEIEQPRGQERKRQGVSVPSTFGRNVTCEVVGNIHDEPRP